VIREVPANIPQANLVSKSAYRAVPKYLCWELELRNGLANRLEAQNRPLLDMLRVELSNFELLLSCEVHHENVERVCTW